MDNVNKQVVEFFKSIGFTLIEIKSSVFRTEESTWVFQTDHKDHSVDASTILYEDAEKIFTQARLALLTELRDCGLLEEKEEHQDWCKLTGELEYSSCGCWKDHNTLARAIKAHLDELIKQRKKNPKDICEKCMKLV